MAPVDYSLVTTSSISSLPSTQSSTFPITEQRHPDVETLDSAKEATVVTIERSFPGRVDSVSPPTNTNGETLDRDDSDNSFAPTEETKSTYPIHPPGYPPPYNSRPPKKDVPVKVIAAEMGIFVLGAVIASKIFGSPPQQPNTDVAPVPEEDTPLLTETD